MFAKRTIILFLMILFSISGWNEACAFDSITKKESYLGPKYITLGLGLGFSSIMGHEGVSGGNAFGFDLSLGHEISHSLSADFSYKFSLVDFVTPNSNDITQKVSSTFIFHGEQIRLFYKYPNLSIQPYVFAGIGIYSFSSVDSKTGMEFPTNLQVPVGAGVIWYLYRDSLSFKAGFDYHILFGENQQSAVNNLLGINRVSFDLYSVMFTVTWHLF